MSPLSAALRQSLTGRAALRTCGRLIAKQPSGLVVGRDGEPASKVVEERRRADLRPRSIIRGHGPAAIIQAIGVPRDGVDVDSRARSVAQ